jgi:hypothetical protein
MRTEPSGLELLLVGGGLEPLKLANADLVERDVLDVRAPMPQREALELVAAADYALQLNASEVPYAVSTKVYEYAGLHVPVISLNYGGEIDTLIREHGFGHSIDLSHEADLVEFVRSLPNRAAADRDGRLAFDVEPFTHPALARRYSALIDDLTSSG